MNQIFINYILGRLVGLTKTINSLVILRSNSLSISVPSGLYKACTNNRCSSLVTGTVTMYVRPETQ